MSEHLVLGIDIGGTNTKVALVNQKGIILHSSSFPTQSYSNRFEDFLSQLEKCVTALMTTTQKTLNDTLGIGVGVPNANFTTGKLESPPNLKAWDNVDIKKALETTFARPVLIDNDANIAALGELHWGKGKKLQDFVVLTLGTGVGCGIIANGQIIRGDGGLASEAGHIILYPQGRKCSCGGRGHLEMYCSAQGIEITVAEILNKKVPFREIVSLFKEQDKSVNKAIQKATVDLGLGLATLGTTLMPKKFILAGGGASLGERFARKVQVEMNKHIYPPFRNRIDVEVSEISQGNGAVLGAASLLLSGLIQMNNP